jgi:hypothetical protein
MKYYNLLLVIAILILLYYVFQLIHILSSHGIIYFCHDCDKKRVKESFVNDSTSHTVDLPINTRYSCKNFCGPTSRCAITGHQCFTDVDCPGCQPNIKQSTEKKKQENAEDEHVPGDNDAGKLTIGVTPQYSSLTSGFGTQEMVLPHENKPARADFGINTWASPAEKSQQLFDKRYKPRDLEFMPSYPQMYSLTGKFVSDGPFPSNY